MKLLRVPHLDKEHLPVGTLSIAVFGPGKGEAIVVQLPDESVGVVDGCREPTDAASGQGDPVRELLARIGCPELAFVCLTHPHDDHYAGLGHLLEQYRGRVGAIWKPPYSARYAKALLFYQQRIRAGEEDLPDKEVVRGLDRLIHQMTEARDQVRHHFKTAVAHRPLLERAGTSIWSVGPADADVDRAEHDLIRAIDDLVNGKKAARGIDPNLTSSALLLRWGKTGILLAGDLLRGGGRHIGWKVAHPAISEPVQVVNLAHHASEEAHDEELWAKMSPKLGIVTPFRMAAGGHPPRPQMIAKLLKDCPIAITTPPDWIIQKNTGITRKIPTSRMITGRNTASAPHATEGNRENAVAVSLDKSGNILQVVLAGDADLYELNPEVAAG